MNKSISYDILLIDDEPKNLELLLLALNDYGFTIITATSGKEGIALAEEVSPDLILLDIQMPEMDGFEVCKQLKSHSATVNIPIMFLSGCRDVESKIKGFEVGAIDYISKPAKARELYARIAAHLNQQQRYNTLKNRLKSYQQQFGSLSTAYGSNSEVSQRHIQQVYQARKLLLSNLCSPPTLQELATQVGSNSHKLSKDFQTLYGQTVFSWLRDYCLQEASRLLSDNKMSIEQIALSVGYSSNANFSTAFKRRFKLTPREYRKSQQFD